MYNVESLFSTYLSTRGSNASFMYLRIPLFLAGSECNTFSNEVNSDDWNKRWQTIITNLWKPLIRDFSLALYVDYKLELGKFFPKVTFSLHTGPHLHKVRYWLCAGPMVFLNQLHFFHPTPTKSCPTSDGFNHLANNTIHTARLIIPLRKSINQNNSPFQCDEICPITITFI